MFICLRPPPFLGFCLGWSSNFVDYESGQIQSETPAEYGLQQESTPPTPSQPHTVSIYCTLTQERGKGEIVEPERRLEGQQITKLGRKIPTWLTVSPVYKLLINACRKALLRSINFFRWRHFCLVPLLLISSWFTPTHSQLFWAPYIILISECTLSYAHFQLINKYRKINKFSNIFP